MSYGVESIWYPRRYVGQTDGMTERRPVVSPHTPWTRLQKSLYRNHCTYYLRQKYVWGRIVVTYVPIRGNDRNIFTNVNTVPHLTHDCEFGHESILEGNVVCLVCIFLGEYIRTFYFAWDILDAQNWFAQPQGLRSCAFVGAWAFLLSCCGTSWFSLGYRCICWLVLT